MAGNQSNRQQKRSRASDAAEKVSRPEEPSKRRRTSEGNEEVQGNEVQGTSEKSSTRPNRKARRAIGEEKRKNAPVPWSFSRPVGGRYSNLDPVVTDDEA